MELSRKSGHRNLRKGRVSLPGQIYLVTATTDHREPFFTVFPLACAAAKAITEPRTDLTLLCWVLMPDHLHALVELRDGSLSQAVGGLKGASARAVNRARNARGSIWAPTFHDHALRREEDVVDVARYIICNPLRAGLVRSVRDYPFWDAIWLE